MFHGFHEALICYALPANLSHLAHSGLPAHPAARLTSLAGYLRTGYPHDGPPVPAALPVFGAGRTFREAKPASAVYLHTHECPAACSGRGRCLLQQVPLLSSFLYKYSSNKFSIASQ